MMQMNNPIFQIQQLLHAGRNPNQILSIMLQNNPQARQAMQMLNGKTPQQVEQMARNMARERGTTVENVAQTIGIQFPGVR